jgi:ribosome biogenesis GTPase
MTLEDLGYNDILEKFRIGQNLENFQAGRVTAEHKERYIIKTDNGEYEAEITGNMRHTAKGRSDYPAVGDWVALSIHNSDYAIIHKIYPRKSVIERQAVGKFGEKQIIAANIDYAFVIQAVDRDFNINRIERYLTICYSAKVEPIIILSKTDLTDETELESLIAELRSRIKSTQIIPISNLTKIGYNKLRVFLLKGKTYCFLGSSGAGKSTLINNLIGKEIFKTDSISTSTGKGRHTTNYRELNILENGSILIDNPGMREVGIADTSDGLEITFDTIVRISGDCKFADCTHVHEKGCAVKDAVEKGVIDRASYENYLKMESEKRRFQASIAEKRKKDKAFGKLCKEGMKYRKQNKY